MRTLRSVILVGVLTGAFGATSASAEFLRIDDSDANRITVIAGGFRDDRLTVNGTVFNARLQQLHCRLRERIGAHTLRPV